MRTDPSFLFFMGEASAPVVIWESVEINKATYILKPNPALNPIEDSIRNIEHFLMSDTPKIRTYLRRNQPNLIPGVSRIVGVNHEYQKDDRPDISWKSSIDYSYIFHPF